MILDTIRQYVNVQQITMAGHMAIVDAMLGGDGQQAAETMHEHLRHTSNSVVALIFPER